MSAGVEIRPPAEHEREDVATLLATSLNFGRQHALARAHLFVLDDMRVAVDAGRVVSVAAEFRFDQWFGGDTLACSAVWGVATLPEHRGKGLASATIGAVLDAARDRGAPIASLFPATMRPYRALGFEMAGTFTKHRIAIDAIPPQPAGLPVPELFDLDRDLAGVRACFRAYASRQTGPVEPTGDEHWATRILIRTDDETRRAVVVREAGEITGFLVTGRHDEAGLLDVSFGLWSEAFVATTEVAMRSLLAYVRRFAGLGRSFTWSGPPNDPIGLLVEEQTIGADLHLRWMSRLLDVPRALAARGWPAIDAEAVFAVDDPRYPENAGPWRLALRGGTASVEPADAAETAGPPIPVGVASSMFTGYLRARDAVRLGYFRGDDPAVGAFEAAFAGPDPWCPVFF